MELSETTLSAFRDELEKIGGMARFGRTPMLPGTAAEKASVGRAAKGLGKFFKTKISGPALNPRHVGAAALSGGALALYGQHKLKKMHEDYQTGRSMRRAQQGG